MPLEGVCWLLKLDPVDKAVVAVLLYLVVVVEDAEDEAGEKLSCSASSSS